MGIWNHICAMLDWMRVFSLHLVVVLEISIDAKQKKRQSGKILNKTNT
jgi:hypothetical protein